MESILNKLYKLLDNGDRTPETAQASQQAEPQYNRLMELAESSNELDVIWAAAIAVGAADDPVWFARGFRMGARLMLAVLEES